MPTSSLPTMGGKSARASGRSAISIESSAASSSRAWSPTCSAVRTTICCRCEAVLQFWKDGTSIEDSVEKYKDDDHAKCSSQYGPVPDFGRYDPPAEDKAVPMIERRFGLFRDSGGAGRMSATLSPSADPRRHHAVPPRRDRGLGWHRQDLHDRASGRRVPRAPGVSLDQILVLTYTERAAEELRQRIRSKIEAVLFDAPVEDPNCDHDTRQGVWLVDDQARGRLRHALYSFDAAAIGTIHGFFGRVLTEHAFASGRRFRRGAGRRPRALRPRLQDRPAPRSLAIQPSDCRRAAGHLDGAEGSRQGARRAGDAALQVPQLAAARSSRRSRSRLSPSEIQTSPLFKLDLGAVAEGFASGARSAGVKTRQSHSRRDRRPVCQADRS